MSSSGNPLYGGGGKIKDQLQMSRGIEHQFRKCFFKRHSRVEQFPKNDKNIQPLKLGSDPIE